MAEKPSEGKDLLPEVWAIIFVFFVISTIFNFQGPSQNDNDRPSRVNSEIDGKLSFVGRFFPTGNFSVNKKIVNMGEVVVRSEPAGQVLGMQKNREKGVILAGPIERFEKTWWRIDYKNAPDGWVAQNMLTANTFLFGIANIIPITFELLKPFFILLAILISVLIFIVFLKIFDLKKILKKKTQFANEKKILEGKDNEISHGIEEELGEIDEIEIENLPTGEDSPKTESPKNRRWSSIQSLINSHSVNDWRQAIIEADIILEEMLDKMGYKGESVGDKLKKIEPSDFLTLDKAWEAHKMRNRIAHKGSSYVLSKDDAEKAIELYREVFSEFYYI